MIVLLVVLFLVGIILSQLPYLIMVVLLLLWQLGRMFKSYWYYKYVAVPISCIIALFVWLVILESPSTQWPMIIIGLFLPAQLFLMATCYYFWNQKHVFQQP